MKELTAKRYRWYFRGRTIKADEVGTVTFTCPESGWYHVTNHYGAVTASRMPWSFWQGLRAAAGLGGKA